MGSKPEDLERAREAAAFVTAVARRLSELDHLSDTEAVSQLSEEDVRRLMPLPPALTKWLIEARRALREVGDDATSRTTRKTALVPTTTSVLAAIYHVHQEAVSARIRREQIKARLGGLDRETLRTLKQVKRVLEGKERDLEQIGWILHAVNDILARAPKKPKGP